jgi:hypothetical protein
MRRPLLVLAAVVLLLGVAIGAYLAGETAAPDARDAAQARDVAMTDSAATAEPRAYGEARRTAFEQGVEQGRTRGRRVGRRNGSSAAKRKARRMVAASAAQAPTAAAARAPKVICDGAIADDAHYEACLRQSGDGGHLDERGRYVAPGG